MSAALTGPAAFLGRSYRQGWLEGLAGSGLELHCFDDGYRAEVAAANGTALLASGVLAVVGCVGTPISNAIVEPCGREGALFFGPLTGAAELRQPDHALHVRASYEDEIRAILLAFERDGLGPYDLALVVQSEPDDLATLDPFGLSVVDAFERALADIHGELDPAFLATRRARIPHNASDSRAAARALYQMRPTPRGVLLASTSLACARLLRMVRPVLPRTRFAALSFCGATHLVRAAGPAVAEGTLAALPLPLDGHLLPGGRRIPEAVCARATENLVQYEGYVAATVLRAFLEDRTDLSRAEVLQCGRAVRGGDGVVRFADREDPNDRVSLLEVRGGHLERTT